MYIENLSIEQILVAVIFIAGLIFLQIYIAKNKSTIRGKWSSGKRIEISETTRLGPTEKLQIINIDNRDYLYFFGLKIQISEQLCTTFSFFSDFVFRNIIKKIYNEVLTSFITFIGRKEVLQGVKHHKNVKKIWKKYFFFKIHSEAINQYKIIKEA